MSCGGMGHKTTSPMPYESSHTAGAEDVAVAMDGRRTTGRSRKAPDSYIAEAAGDAAKRARGEVVVTHTAGPP